MRKFTLHDGKNLRHCVVKKISLIFFSLRESVLCRFVRDGCLIVCSFPIQQERRLVKWCALAPLPRWRLDQIRHDDELKKSRRNECWKKSNYQLLSSGRHTVAVGNKVRQDEAILQEHVVGEWNNNTMSKCRLLLVFFMLLAAFMQLIHIEQRSTWHELALFCFIPSFHFSVAVMWTEKIRFFFSCIGAALSSSIELRKEVSALTHVASSWISRHHSLNQQLWQAELHEFDNWKFSWHAYRSRRIISIQFTRARMGSKQCQIETWNSILSSFSMQKRSLACRGLSALLPFHTCLSN